MEAAFEQTSCDLVIPCDEEAVRHLHELHRTSASPATRALIQRSLGSQHGYSIAETRHDLLVVAGEEGIRAPVSRPIATIAALSEWHAEVPLPWVLKADGSCAGQGVRIVSSLHDAQASFLDLNKPVSARMALNKWLVDRDPFWLKRWRAGTRPAISVQSYVEGRPANCSVACWEGEVLAGICMEVVVAESKTGPSTVGRVVDNPEMLEATRKVVRRLGLSGLAGFDFMIEAATGAAYMIEMNPRNTPVCHINLGAGRDLVEALTAKIGGRPMRYRPPVTANDIIAFFPDAWRRDPENEYLFTAYHDVPWEEPALVRELIRPERRDRLWLTRWLRRIRGHKAVPPMEFRVPGPARTMAAVSAVTGQMEHGSDGE
ncbi:MAG: ATP-grasp domain-containing protein [Rhodopila sp.]|nr:ATP-grasp domain-containing protein [Rhodopila sp.]